MLHGHKKHIYDHFFIISFVCLFDSVYMAFNTLTSPTNTSFFASAALALISSSFLIFSFQKHPSVFFSFPLKLMRSFSSCARWALSINFKFLSKEIFCFKLSELSLERGVFFTSLDPKMLKLPLLAWRASLNSEEVSIVHVEKISILIKDLKKINNYDDLRSRWDPSIDLIDCWLEA